MPVGDGAPVGGGAASIWSQLIAAEETATTMATTMAASVEGLVGEAVVPLPEELAELKLGQLGPVQLEDRLPTAEDEGIQLSGSDMDWVRRRVYPARISGNRPPAHQFEMPGAEAALARISAVQIAALARCQAAARGAKVRRRGEMTAAIKAERMKKLKRKFRVATKVIMATTGRKRVIKRARKRRAAEKRLLPPKRNLPHCFIAIAYFICLLWCLFCGLYTIAIGVYFGPVASTKWLVSISTTHCTYDSFLKTNQRY
jgi:hypothetical protein